jgi:hypothetical protein
MILNRTKCTLAQFLQVNFKTALMRQFLLLIFVSVSFLSLNAQKDTANVSFNSSQRELIRDVTNVNISIYPVPVRENIFTIKSDKEISAIKITNIIGQDIFRVKYTSPQFISRILLDNPKRGMYLVAIVFSDNTRVVKKIMVEEFN